MKPILADLLQQALVKIAPELSEITPQIEHARNKQFGDFASNIALTASKQVGIPPRDFAQQLIDALPSHPSITETHIAGPGFINFKVSQAARAEILPKILNNPDTFGQSQLGAGTKVHLEYVSANPTGPLHVGHGRGAAFGSSLANMLRFAGYNIHTEYYINDAGRQMDILTVSVWLRYLEQLGDNLTFPANAYQGDYITDIAKTLLSQYQDQFRQTINTTPGDDPEAHIDQLIQSAKNLLGEHYHIIHSVATQVILDDIKQDLSEFKVDFNQWFSEKSLDIQRGITALEKTGHVYRKDDALWFNAVHYGDEKDRVLKRANGQRTYFASDVTYHWDKFERGFDQIIDIFGADHHGYIARVKAAVAGVGHNPELVNVLLVQFATLYRGKEKLSMSTRSGEFVTLRQLREEVGVDAARFFYVMRKPEQHMDFDLALAKSETADNPVYYIQYAHARICSVLRQLADRKWTFDQNLGLAHTELLSTVHENMLLERLARYPELIEQASKQYEPHQLAQYCRDLAADFQSYYNAQIFLVDNENLRNARLCLIIATKHVLKSALNILGVSAPEQM